MSTQLRTISRKMVQRIVRKYLIRLHATYDFPHMAVFSNDGLGQAVITEGWAEKHFLKQLSNNVFPKINMKSVALDIGANVGNHSLWFSKHFNQVHSFEPNKRAFLLLKANAMLTSNITVHNVGCSNESVKNQQASFSKHNIGGARLNSSPPNKHFPLDKNLLEKTFFDLVKLDDYFPQHLHDRVGFIKCDVEGHEELVLRGAEKILLKSKPVIAFEVNDFEGVWNYLASLGYSYCFGITKFRGIKTIKILPNVLKIIPISKDNLSQVYRDLVIASTIKLGIGK